MAMSPKLLRPIASGFNPARIAGLQLWLDAADSSTITVDTGVSQWRDKSIVGSVWAQSTGNEQPATGTQTLNGRNVLVFDGSNDSLSASAPLTTSMPLSFFLVQRIISKTSFGMSYTTSTSSDALNIRQSSSSGGLNIVANNSIVINQSSGADRTGINDILSWVVPSSGNSVLRRNGTQLTLDGPSLKPVLTGTHYLGRRSDGFYANIWLAEVVAYNTLLSDLQRNAVESYLGKKWGISIS